MATRDRPVDVTTILADVFKCVIDAAWCDHAPEWR